MGEHHAKSDSDLSQVTEQPPLSRNTEDTLFGKGLKPGYDSHYALVRKVGEMNYFPCKHDDPNGPDYDEIVIFDPSQVQSLGLCK